MKSKKHIDKVWLERHLDKAWRDLDIRRGSIREGMLSDESCKKNSSTVSTCDYRYLSEYDKKLITLSNRNARQTHHIQPIGRSIHLFFSKN